MAYGTLRQQAIYLAGVAGRKPRVPTHYGALEARAREVMDAKAFAYMEGGAGEQRTVRANRDDWDAWRIVPRMLRDVSARDSSVELLGRRHAAPFMLAPVGVLEMAHRGADAAVARAAAAEGVGVVLSNQASQPMEDVCRAAGPDVARWFQLYWSTDDDLVRSFVGRAERAGCEAIAVTLDTTLLGWRPRDLDLGSLPFLQGKGIAQYTSDPVFTRLLAEPAAEAAPTPPPTPAAIQSLITLVRNYPAPFLQALRSGRARAAVQRFVRIYSRPSLTWADIARLREMTSLPIVLKGVLHADDARQAVETGVDAVWVSNHGGRQVDGAISTIRALPDVVAAVDGRVPVVMDSGVRGGADVFRALALGATMTFIGRPYAYGLALDGERGVRDVLANLKADVDLTMGLAGCRSVDEVRATELVPA
jgi:lactate 2-monooxygenase